MLTVEDVRRAIQATVRQFAGTGWDYLVKQFPIVLDDGLTMVDKVNLDEHETFSFANPYYVGFSESRALAQIQDYYKQNNLELLYSELLRNVRNVLIHEYGHILLEHVFEKPKKTPADIEAQVITAEIETNRGIPKCERAQYFDEIIVSDDKPEFETVKPFITHEAVYNAVKKLRQDQSKKQQDNQCSNRGGNGDKNDSDKKQGQKDSQNKTESPNQPNQPNQNSEQDGNEKEHKRPDNVGTMIQAMRNADSDDNSLQKDLLTELGLNPSKEFNESKDINGKLKELRRLSQNNNIKKALSKIKGELAGELSRDKVGTYSRPSRKTSEDGLMRRGTKRGAPKRPKVLIALDESGSMDSTAVQTAATAIKMIARTIGRNRTDVTICSFYHYIDKVEKLSNYERVVNSYSPRGGTEFRLVVDLAEQQGCDVVICIGDGGDILPSKQFDGRLKKWIDVLITQNDITDLIKERMYNDIDNETGRRETYWLGDDKKTIEQFTGDM